MLEKTYVLSAITCINFSGSGSSGFQTKTNVTGPGYSIFYWTTLGYSQAKSFWGILRVCENISLKIPHLKS